MKPRRRVLVIARHFWPATNDDTLRLFYWTQQLVGQGAAVTVVTPRWHNSWPRRVVCDGVTVIRLDHPPSHSLRFGSYGRQLSQWLNSCGDFDLVYCDSSDADAATVLSQIERTAPVVVRFTELAEGPKALVKALEVCRRANLVLVNTHSAQKVLLAAGIQRPFICRTGQVLGTRFDRSPEARRLARKVLGDCNHDLFARTQDRVLVCPGELSRDWGVLELLRELSPLIEEQRSLRVWLLGDSRERPGIYQRLRHEGLHRLVAMPGIFTDLEEVMQAADLCIFPAPGAGLGWLLPTCLASGLPVLVADSPDARWLLGEQAAQLTVRIEQPDQLRGLVTQWLTDPTPWVCSAAEARKYAADSPAASLSCEDLFLLLEGSARRHA